MRADAGWQGLESAAVHRGVLPENIVVADFQRGRLASVFEILGLSANGGKREKLVAAAEFRMPFKHDVRVQDAIVAEFDIRADDTERPDVDIVSQLGEG